MAFIKHGNFRNLVGIAANKFNQVSPGYAGCEFESQPLIYRQTHTDKRVTLLFPYDNDTKIGVYCSLFVQTMKLTSMQTIIKGM